MSDIQKWPERKTAMFLLMGIILYLGSAYLNSYWGLWIGFVVILISIIAQIINWYFYFDNKKYDKGKRGKIPNLHDNQPPRTN